MGRRRELERDGAAVVLIDGDAVHLLQHLDTALHLPCLGGLVAEPLDEALDLRYLLLLVLVGGLLALNAFQPLLHILRVAALVVLDVAEGDLDGAVGDAVEEGAVVGDEDDAAVVVGQVVFQPLDRLDVEVVGGLVEEDDLGFLEEDFGEADAHLPAVAEGGHREVELLAQEAHTREHLLGLGLHRVAAEMLVAVVKVGELLGELRVGVGFVVRAFCELVGDALHLAFHILDFGEGGDGLVPHGERGVAGEFLRQVAHAVPGGDDHRAGGGLQVAVDDFEQRGFARAVVAHQTDAVFVARHERDVLEEEVSREIYRQFVYLYQGRGYGVWVMV